MSHLPSGLHNRPCRYSYQHATPPTTTYSMAVNYFHSRPTIVTNTTARLAPSDFFFVSSVFYWLPTWFAFVFVSSALPLNLSTRVLMPVLTRTLAWYPPPIATLDLIRARLYPLDRLSTTHHPRITDMSTGLTITDSTDTFTARLRTITNYVTRSPITTPSRS